MLQGRYGLKSAGAHSQVGRYRRRRIRRRYALGSTARRSATISSRTGSSLKRRPLMTSSPDLLAALAQTRCTAPLLIIDRPPPLRLAPEQALLQVSNTSPGVLQLLLQGLLTPCSAFHLRSQPFPVLTLQTRQPLRALRMQALPIPPLPDQLNVLLPRESNELPRKGRIPRCPALCEIPRRQTVHAAYRTGIEKWCSAPPLQRPPKRDGFTEYLRLGHKKSPQVYDLRGIMSYFMSWDQHVIRGPGAPVPGSASYLRSNW